jgi:hypothetical protein
VPTIAFGVPAGASMAILLGAFMMHGLTPGPDMLTKHLDVTYTIVWSLTLAHIIGALICLSCSRWLARIATVRPEILLPIVLALVFVAAYEGAHDWGDLYAIMIFGVIGWIMKRLGWPRPPMVLGIVIGGIFERYLYISTSLYGSAWMLRPVVLAIFAFVAWALYRPLAQILAGLIAEFRAIRVHRLRLQASAAFTIAVIAFIVTAIWLAGDWPAAAKPVPLTACAMALAAACLNLINELFGRDKPQAAARERATVELAPEFGVSANVARWRALSYFFWLAGFVALIALIGFVPAIAVFVFSYMRFGFGERTLRSAGFACATAVLCWALFDQALAVAWPHALLGDAFPDLRARIGLI